MALTGEAGELTELFQWLTEEQSRDVCKDAATSAKVEQELADVMLYLVRLSDVLGVDLNQAVINKLKLNTEKYPVGLAYGSSKKYDELNRTGNISVFWPKNPTDDSADYCTNWPCNSATGSCACYCPFLLGMISTSVSLVPSGSFRSRVLTRPQGSIPFPGFSGLGKLILFSLIPVDKC